MLRVRYCQLADPHRILNSTSWSPPRVKHQDAPLRPYTPVDTPTDKASHSSYSRSLRLKHSQQARQDLGKRRSELALAYDGLAEL